MVAVRPEAGPTEGEPMYAEKLDSQATNLRTDALDEALKATGLAAPTAEELAVRFRVHETTAVNERPTRRTSGDAADAGFTWLLAEASVCADPGDCGWLESRERTPFFW